jgi:hypothetical protein
MLFYWVEQQVPDPALQRRAEEQERERRAAVVDGDPEPVKWDIVPHPKRLRDVPAYAGMLDRNPFAPDVGKRGDAGHE